MNENCLKLWLIHFNILETDKKGAAVAWALNAEDAQQLVKKKGMYNGEEWKYEIISIEEIITPVEEDLIVEVINNNY